jgi:hypothetical protein
MIATEIECRVHSGFEARIEAGETQGEKQEKQINDLDRRLTALENKIVGAVVATGALSTAISLAVQFLKR